MLIETWYNGHSSDVDDVVERRVARRDDVIFAEVVNQPVPEMGQLFVVGTDGCRLRPLS